MSRYCRSRALCSAPLERPWPNNSGIASSVISHDRTDIAQSVVCPRFTCKRLNGARGNFCAACHRKHTARARMRRPQRTTFCATPSTFGPPVLVDGCPRSARASAIVGTPSSERSYSRRHGRIDLRRCCCSQSRCQIPPCTRSDRSPQRCYTRAHATPQQ